MPPWIWIARAVTKRYASPAIAFACAAASAASAAASHLRVLDRHLENALGTAGHVGSEHHPAAVEEPGGHRRRVARQHLLGVDPHAVEDDVVDTARAIHRGERGDRDPACAGLDEDEREDAVVATNGADDDVRARRLGHEALRAREHERLATGLRARGNGRRIPAAAL